MFMRLGAQRIVRGVAVALVTNYLPAYRIPLYTLLAERLGVEVYCFGGEGHYVPEAMRDLDRQLRGALRFPPTGSSASRTPPALPPATTR